MIPNCSTKVKNLLALYCWTHTVRQTKSHLTDSAYFASTMIASAILKARTACYDCKENIFLDLKAINHPNDTPCCSIFRPAARACYVRPFVLEVYDLGEWRAAAWPQIDCSRKTPKPLTKGYERRFNPHTDEKNNTLLFPVGSVFFFLWGRHVGRWRYEEKSDSLFIPNRNKWIYFVKVCCMICYTFFRSEGSWK